MLRKNVAVIWVPSKKLKKGEAEITKIAQIATKRIGIIGRTQANAEIC